MVSGFKWLSDIVGGSVARIRYYNNFLLKFIFISAGYVNFYAVDSLDDMKGSGLKGL
jgi:hypothetical protein